MICGSTDYNIGTNKESIHTDAGKETSSRNIRIPLKEYSAEQDLNAKESRITNINLTKWVSYTDFKKINDSQIAVKRMRPLLSTIRLTINGRQDFHAGKSENPVIGTVEDWFIINTMGMDHPIHIHLINFQVVKVYDLRLYEGSSSTKYELDFVAEGLKNAKSTPDGKVN
jgi:FtsP/CotA-like multicopper oxidase with cupredoxin domain